MVEHMVWIKFHDGIDDARKQQHLDGLKSLAETVPGIVSLKIGKNFTDRANGFTHGLSVTLESVSALKVYADHPDHLAVAKPLREDADLMAMDYEF